MTQKQIIDIGAAAVGIVLFTILFWEPLTNSTSTLGTDQLVPPLTQLKRDRPIVDEMKCHQNQKDSEPLRCNLGNLQSNRTMVLFGDSHAAQWVPALDKIAKEKDWKLISFTKSACPYSRVVARAAGGRDYPSCAEWRENVIDEIGLIRPDLVITSQLRRNNRDLNAGLQGVWRDLHATGAKIVAIRDTPRLPFDPGTCLATTPDKCSVAREKAVADMDIENASTDMPVDVVNMDDLICGSDVCNAVVSNVIVWRDKGHLTATYVETLAPSLADRLGL